MKNLNLISPCNVLGYGQTGYYLLIELSKLYNVSYWPIGNIDYPVAQDDIDIFQKAINNQAEFDISAPCLRIWHQFEMSHMVGKGQHIGFPIFELNKFTKREKHHLGSLDKIFVTSEWAKNIIHSEISDKIAVHVVPLGVDRNIFFDMPTPKHSPYTFINIGKWEIRKGHDILIEAFNNVFNKNDDVELWMMNHNPFLDEKQEKEWVDYYKNSKLGEKIRILPRVPTHYDLANIMRQTHCGVFPSRAEGWNLEALEMMSVGRPVIITNYSAHTEFCNNKNSSLIDVNDTEAAYDGIWFDGNVGDWATIDVDVLGSLMLSSYKEGPIFNQHGVNTANNFTWRNAALSVQKGLD